MEILPLTVDIWTYICKYLSDRDKCIFLWSNKILYEECQPLFTEKINIKKIIGNKWYDNFITINAVGFVIPNIFDFPFNMNYLNIDITNPIHHLPSKVEKIVFDGNSELPVAMFPQNLKKINLYYEFDHPVNNLPSSITHLKFGYLFNQRIDNLPPLVTHLTFGHNFNQSIDQLPSSITHLLIDGKLGYAIKYLPPSIIHLTLGHDFNRYINFEHNLKYLEFGNKFDQPINHLIDKVDNIVVAKTYNFPKHFGMNKITTK